MYINLLKSILLNNSFFFCFQTFLKFFRIFFSTINIKILSSRSLSKTIFLSTWSATVCLYFSMYYSVDSVCFSNALSVGSNRNLTSFGEAKCDYVINTMKMCSFLPWISNSLAIPALISSNIVNIYLLCLYCNHQYMNKHLLSHLNIQRELWNFILACSRF